MATIGERIRTLREHRHLTQEQLSEKTAISKGFLSDVENDKRNISSEYLLRIATTLGASVDYLLRGETKAHAEPIVISPELSEAARQLGLTFAETVELLEAHDSVVARRSIKSTRTFSVNDWIELHKAIKKVFG